MSSMPTVVIFVDSKTRDLMGTALIARHLEKRGIRCRLEPLESWRACIAAWRPDFILFNHLNAPHLATFSQQCREWGVLVGVLPNEGIFYIPETMEYNSRRLVENVHCDLMFSWSELHRDVLVENRFCENPDQVIPVGVPRFDFYKQPWNRLFQKKIADTVRPVILANANFPLAHFADLPPERADNFFSQWKDIIPAYSDYWGAIHGNKSSRQRFLSHLNALFEAGRYFVIVRPHPREDPNFYLQWFDRLPVEHRNNMRLALKENITELILNADLELSCENCTTTLEAWIAGKPTVGLAFNKHPLFYTEQVARLLPECEESDQLVAMIDEALADPSQSQYAEARLRHMEKWMYKVDGRAAERVADAIGRSIAARPKLPDIRPGFSNLRRGMKLRLARAMGEPVNVSPNLYLRRLLKGQRGKQTLRYRDYMKALRPGEERQARDFVRSVDSEGPR